MVHRHREDSEAIHFPKSMFGEQFAPSSAIGRDCQPNRVNPKKIYLYSSDHRLCLLFTAPVKMRFRPRV